MQMAVLQRCSIQKRGSCGRASLTSVVGQASTSGSPSLEPKPFFPTGNGSSQSFSTSNGTPSSNAQNGHRTPSVNSSDNGKDMAHKKTDDVSEAPMLDPSAANKNWVSAPSAIFFLRLCTPGSS